MKAKRFILAVVMLMVSSTLITRAGDIKFSDVSTFTNYLKKTLNAPSEAKESGVGGKVCVMFQVNEKKELQVVRVWSNDLSKNDIMEIEMQLVELENKQITYTGDERMIPVKICFLIK